MSLKVATLTTILGIAASTFLYVRNEVDAQPHSEKIIDNNSVEQTSSIGCPNTEEMNRNAAESGVTEADIDALNQMAQQDGSIVTEPTIRERTPSGEIIYESRAVQTMILTDTGIVGCSSFGNDMPEGEITYIGGPLDNQKK